MESQQAGLEYIVTLVIGGLTLTACVLIFAAGPMLINTDSPPVSEAQEWTVPGQSDVLNVSGRLACRHFRTAYRDASAGPITQPELLAQVRRMIESARASPNQTIRREAETMLEAVKRGDDETFDAAAARMAGECAKHDV